MSLAATAVLLLSSLTGFVGTGDGPFGRPAELVATTDFGAHFRAIGPHVGRDTVVDDVFFLDRLHGWVVMWNADTVRARLYRTSDGGRTWRSIEVASHGLHAGASDTIQFLDRRRGWLVVQEPTAPFATLFATRDGGETWHAVGRTLLQVAPVRFQTTRVAWQAGGLFSLALLRSDDGGVRWRRVALPRPRPERGAQAVYGLPSFFGSTVLAPVTYVRHDRAADVVVYRSREGGRTWKAAPALEIPGGAPASCVPSPYAVAFATPSAWWVGAVHAGRATVYRTVDAGRHWRASLLGSARRRFACERPLVQAANADAGWVELGAGMLATRDGGTGWTILHP